MQDLPTDLNTLSSALKGKTMSVSEVTQSFLDRIAGANETLGAFTQVRAEEALAEAKALDLKGPPPDASPLWGVPVALKENMCLKGVPVTCGSRILENFVSPYDGTAATRLKNAGAVILGSCAMDEFAMGSSSETHAYQTIRNPYDLDSVPGGSSGGSAAAVAAGLVPLALGSDTGGSIRQPASFCGVVGMKPTYGRVSRYGLVAFASSLDQIGPFAGSVKDAAALLQTIAGHEPRDSTSYAEACPDFSASLEQSLEGMRIGLPREYFQEGLDESAREAIGQASKHLEARGAILKEVTLPHTPYAIATYYILATAEASANLSRFDGVRYGTRSQNAEDLDSSYVASRSEGFGMEVKRRIVTGTFVLSSGYYDAYYLKAQKVRTLLCQDFSEAFKEVDLLLTPTSPGTAFKRGERKDDPIRMYLSDIYTVSVNLAGLPALSMPCACDGKGLPIGLQLIAPSLQEARIFQVGHQLEKDLGYQAPELKV